MRILFFDTETTGFPVDGRDLSSQPYVVQLAYLFCDYDETASDVSDIRSFDGLFRSAVPIPEQVSAIHGITDGMVADRPLLSESRDLVDFYVLMHEADAIVGHNVDFDMRMLQIEMRRALSGSEKLAKFPKFHAECLEKCACTMKSSTQLCKIQWQRWYKWPKLAELHQFLFSEWFDGAHDAMNDIRATKRCFDELVRIGAIDMRIYQ